MEEKKTLKIKKPRLIIFALAIAFAIMGFIDLKANAAENLVEGIPVDEQYLKIDNLKYNTSNKHYYNIKHNFSNIQYRIALFYVSDGDYNGYSICTLDTGSYVYLYGNIITEEYDKNMVLLNSDSVDKQLGDNLYTGTTKPVAAHHYYNDGVVMNIYEFKSLTVDTNIPIFTDWDCLREYLETGFYNPSGVVIDYSQLQIDDDMPIPTNFVLSKISNNIVVGLKDYDEMYDYIKWSNTSDLPIQVQVCPIVQVYKNKNLGFSYGAFVRNYDSNYLVDEILEQPTISYIFEVRNDYFVSDIDPYPHTDFLDYYKDIYDKEDTGTFGKYVLNYTCGYRFRYVDIDNMKAGPWIHVWPDRIVGKTVTYITYSDGTFTNDIDSTGTQNKYNGAELDEMIENTETENFYKDKYDGFDTNINVGEATNWLQSVASFIKGTPDFVGSVMSFLPEPIRYGMFVCLFLGVIASGYAIVKALI